jgi:undecaprenyl diphosphate synthase
VVGNIAELPAGARRSLESAMSYTEAGTDMVLSLALSYGARKDIIGAARALAQRVKAGTLQPEDITETLLAREMSTGSLPSVDLLIRTGGESRISDFLLYESAYAELLFMPVMWPDFGEKSVSEAIAHYSQRERRYGLTSGQVTNCLNGLDPVLNLAEARATSRSMPFAAEAE